MRYWILMAFAIIGGILLINGGLREILALEGRIVLIAGIFSLGVGRRMLQERLHRRTTES